MLAAARQMELEGVVAKRLDSPYRPGARSPDWLKVKIVADDEFVIEHALLRQTVAAAATVAQIGQQ